MSTEIEMRARFDEGTHDALTTQLRGRGQDLGEDNKYIYFYVLADRLIKVVHNVSHGDAKLALKSERIGRSNAFPEIEIAITPRDVPSAVAFLNGLGLENTMHEAHNQRHNYRYRHVEIALKWSEAWGHHAEFEVLLDADQPHPDDVTAAETRIRAVAEDLGISLMSEEELLAFTGEFERGLRGHNEDAHGSTVGTGE